MSNKIFAFQDGAQFYWGYTREQAESDTGHNNVWHAPILVRDSGHNAAKARQMFLREFDSFNVEWLA